MPAAPKTAKKAAAMVAPGKVAPRPTGVFARLKAEAEEDRSEPLEPYVLDDVDPPIIIEAPDDSERQLALAELFDSQGGFEVRDARRILQLVCGDAFDRVWELVRHEHISVLVKLIDDMGSHFAKQSQLDGAQEFPGGSVASST